MRFGVFLLAPQFPGQEHGDVLESTVAAAVAAEAAGFDDVWIAEHHFMSYGVCPSAITLAGYLLGATSRVSVGTAVSVLSTRHPVDVAEQAALLDQVSGGRFRLGIGRGGPWVDLEVFGTGLGRYESGFAESLDLLLAAWTRERVHADGEHFRFREVAVVPRPRTRPHPPVLLACTSRASVELAATRGLPMLLGMHVGDADKAELVARYTEAAGFAGDPGHVSAALAYVADTRGEATATMRTALPRWLRPGLAGYTTVDGRPRMPRDPDDYAELLCRLHPVGTVQDCVEVLRAGVATTGIRHVVLMVEGAGERDRTCENIARLGAEVLPRLRDPGDDTEEWSGSHRVAPY